MKKIKKVEKMKNSSAEYTECFLEYADKYYPQFKFWDVEASVLNWENRDFMISGYISPYETIPGTDIHIATYEDKFPIPEEILKDLVLRIYRDHI